MPAFDHHLMPLYPPLEGDSYLGLEAHGLINFHTKSGHELAVRYFCLDEQVRVVAVTVPEEAAGHCDQSKWLRQIMETSISALRLSVDREASPIYTDAGFFNLMYQSDEPEPRYQFPISILHNPGYRLDIRNVLNVFGAISDRTVAPIAALLAEAQVPTVPIHYRILSLIRAIELLYPDEADYTAALERFQPHFAGLNIMKRPFRSALLQLRTRCAHGRSRGRANPEPFVGIGYNEPHLRPLLTLLQSVVAHGLEVLHGMKLGGLTYRPEPPRT